MTARTPELTDALSRVNEEEVGRSGADAPSLSHPCGAEPVPVSGKAGIANAGFTPGPWAIHPIKAFHRYIVPAGHVSRPIGASVDREDDLSLFAQTVCDMAANHRHRAEEEVLANAHLIAAAPELYEALASLCAVLNSNGYSTAHADAALAKARGDS